MHRAYRQLRQLVSSQPKILKKIHNNSHLINCSSVNNDQYIRNRNNLSRYQYSSFHNQFTENRDEQIQELKDFKMYFQLSNKLYDQKKLNESIDALQKAKSIILDAKCQKSRVYVQLILNLVVIYKEITNSQKVKQYLQESFDIISSLEGENYEMKLIIYGNLSDVYFNERQFQNSLKLLKQSQQIFNILGKRQSPESVILYEKIGQVLIQQENFQESINYILKSKELVDKYNAQQTQSYLNLLDKLGYAYYKLKKFQLSAEIHKSKLSYQQKLIGTNCIAYAQTLKTLGFMYRHLDLQQISMDYFQKAFNIAQSLDQLNNPTMYLVSQFLAVYKFQRQLYDQALIYFHRCMLSLQASDLKDYPKYTYILKSIADCNKFLQKFEIAFEKYQNLLALIDEKSSEYAYILAQIGQLHFIWFQYRKSLQVYQKSLKIDIQANGNSQTLHSYNVYQALIQIGKKLLDNEIANKYSKLKVEFETKNHQLLNKNPLNS